MEDKYFMILELIREVLLVSKVNKNECNRKISKLKKHRKAILIGVQMSIKNDIKKSIMGVNNLLLQLKKPILTENAFHTIMYRYFAEGDINNAYEMCIIRNLANALNN